jgi:exopolysaccharide biosynthesis protein
MLIKSFTSPYFRFVRYALLVFLCSLCVYVVDIPAQDFRTLKEGIEYAEVTKEISGKSVNMNILRLDLKKIRLDVHHAKDAAIGTEKTSSIATRHGAFAAINAGFFRLDKSEFAGDPAGILQIDGELLSESEKDRAALAIYNGRKRTKVYFGLANSHAWVSISPNFSSLTVDGINREPKADEAILFTKEFGKLPISSQNVLKIILSRCRFTCGRAKISEDKEATSVPTDGYVFALYGKSAVLLTDDLKKKLTDDFLSVIVSNISKFVGKKERRIEEADDITNGVSLLVRNRKIQLTWEQEKTNKAFVETRHPRTAVAKLKDGKFLMITVDGRSEASGGIGLQDLAEYMLSLGAVDAMNLDGGGSTTMFVDGKVVNKPSDKEGERKVSDAILVTPRTKK